MRLRTSLCSLLVILVAGASSTWAATVVSLTFDDGLDDQAVVDSMLAAHGMKGTFFINSGHVGTAGYLTWGQLTGIAAHGHEIAGHTLDHTDLTTLDSTGVRWEVCEDRGRLLKHGFGVMNFAYPYGAGRFDSTIRSIIQSCGYNSGRGAWGLVGPDCTSCTAWAETIPPSDFYAIKTADNPQSTTTVGTIESYVTGAETHGGGWVILVFHHICDDCDQYSTPQATLQSFLDWLQPRAANGTTVKTMSQVIGGPLQTSPGTADTIAPVSSIFCDGFACSSNAYTAPVQVSLSATDSGGSSLEAIRYTTDGTDPTLTSPVYGAPFTVSQTTTVRYRAWDNAGNTEPTRSQVIQFAAPTPMSTTTPTPARTSTPTRTPTSTPPPTSTPIPTATVTPPPTPTSTATPTPTATATPVITPPTTSILCNGGTCSSGWYRASVQVALTATPGSSAVAAIRYTTDGTDPTTSSPLYGAPFTVSTTTPVKFRAWGADGGVEPTNTQLIQIDAVAPTVAITSPAAGARLSGKVRIAGNASDVGSGVARVTLSIDGNAVATFTTVSFQYNWNTNKVANGQHTITVVAVDRAGNTGSASITVTII